MDLFSFQHYLNFHELLSDYFAFYTNSKNDQQF